MHFWAYANQAKRQGAKLICIDPRKTETADKCHQHIAVLPGTDPALRQRLERAHESAMRSARLVSQLLTLARAEPEAVAAQGWAAVDCARLV